MDENALNQIAGKFGVSESVRRLNSQHAAINRGIEAGASGKLAPIIDEYVRQHQELKAAEKATTQKRIRQSSKPLMNGLETQFLNEVLVLLHPEPAKIRAQAFRVKIASGAWFKVDFLVIDGSNWTAYEVKGSKGKNIDRGKLALKVSAHLWPEIKWVLCWRDLVTRDWIRQEIKS